MIRASVSEAKQKLSVLLQAVRRGEQVLITHRGRPFARIDPIELPVQNEQIASLIERGIILPAKNKLDIDGFQKMQLPKSPSDGTLVEAVIEEREEGL